MNAIRKLQFMVRGYCDFTKWQKPLPPLEGSLHNQSFVITGANSGIGLAAATDAAKRGAQVYLVCRSEERGKTAVNQIIEKSKNQKVFLILGQMGDLDQMKSVHEQLKSKLKRIDFLVHNAGCMIHKQQFTKDKIQKNFATNTLAVYYLTKLCFDLLDQNSRTIVVSSGGCLTQTLEVDDLFMYDDKFDGTDQYARNKRQQLVIVQQFAKKYPKNGLFVSMHPGWVDTLAVRTSMPDFHKKMEGKLKSEDEGADTIMYLALAQTSNLKNGQFYFDRKIADKHLTISCTTHKKKYVDLFMQKIEKMCDL